jgi:phage gp16-like protein
MVGICRFLKIKNIPKTLKGSNGNEKLNDLYSKVKKTYLKGYQTKELIAALDMAAIRNKNKEALSEFETALGVRCPSTSC